MTAPAEILAVFARAPELGRVKTRLCPPLTADEAVRLHRALVEDTLDHLLKLNRPGLSRVLLLSRPLLQATDLDVPRGWTVGIQSPGDLGAKLASFFYGAFRREVLRVVVLGSDSPTLPLEVVHDAFEELSRVDVTLGPAADGGYYLIGLRRFLPDLFRGISWGTDRVLQQTKDALEKLGHRYKLLVPWYDVDRPRDMEKLREEIGYLQRANPDLVPKRSAAALPEIEDSEFSLGPEFE
ncbi:MAG TPA: TIGR04282 family arsenosugar biosynthesis glycosyltransferase [Vicinamibacteria bacterium]